MEGGLINLLPVKRGDILETGGLNRRFMVYFLLGSVGFQPLVYFHTD